MSYAINYFLLEKSNNSGGGEKIAAQINKVREAEER